MTSSLAPVPTDIPSQWTMVWDLGFRFGAANTAAGLRLARPSPYIPCRSTHLHSQALMKLSLLPSTPTMVNQMFKLTLTLSASPHVSLVLVYHRHGHRMGLAWCPRKFLTLTYSNPHRAHLCAQNTCFHSSSNNCICSRADHSPSFHQNIVSFHTHQHRHCSLSTSLALVVRMAAVATSLHL